MANIITSGVLYMKDDENNLHAVYPVTKLENITNLTEATPTSAGLMSAEDKETLNNLKNGSGGSGSSCDCDIPKDAFVDNPTDTLTWDGNTDGLEYVDMGNGMVAYHISDAVPTPADIVNGMTLIAKSIYTLSSGSTDEQNVPLSMDSLDIVALDTAVTAVSMEGNILAVVCSEDNHTLDIGDGVTVICPKKGTYYCVTSMTFEEGDTNVVYPISTTINGYKGFTHPALNDEMSPISVKKMQQAFSGSITWDGKTDELDYVDTENGSRLYHISDVVPTDLSGNSVAYVYDPSDPTQYQRMTSALVFDSKGSAHLAENISGLLLVVCNEDNYTVDGITFPKKGIYYQKIEKDNIVGWIEEVSFNNIIIELKESYLPQSVRKRLSESGSGGSSCAYPILVDENGAYIEI